MAKDYKYTITLDEIEQKAMEYIAVDVDAWIQNAVHERARLGMEEMVANHVEDALATGKPISGNKHDIALETTLPNAKKRHEDMLKKLHDKGPPGTVPNPPPQEPPPVEPPPEEPPPESNTA